jgi:hypothetical protein
VRIADTGSWRGQSGGAGERGLGLPLMRGLMDRVDIVHAGDGTVVVLERRLDAPGSARPAASAGVFADTRAGTTQS